MNSSIKDTLGTLLPASSALANLAMDGSAECFKNEGHVCPIIFAVPANSKELVFIPVLELTPKTKPMVWNMLRAVRESNPISGFIAETWMSFAKPGEKLDLRVMPSQDPDRTESILFSLWEGSRMINFMARINRNPNSLSPWEIMYDSNFPRDDKDGMCGGMVDGGRFPLNKS